MMRADLNIIYDWIAPDAHVLDLACGDGVLLENLARHKGVTGYGLEIDPDGITRCVARGVSVIEHNLDDGLASFRDQSYDQVIMTQALQALRRPDKLLHEMLRVADEGIITFPTLPTGATACIWGYAAICRCPSRYPTPGTIRPTFICRRSTTLNTCAAIRGWSSSIAPSG